MICRYTLERRDAAGNGRLFNGDKNKSFKNRSPLPSWHPLFQQQVQKKTKPRNITECLKYHHAAMFLLTGTGSRRFTISRICWSESLWTRAPASCAVSATSRLKTGTTHSSTILELFTLTRKTRKHSTTEVASCASKLSTWQWYWGGKS